MNYIGIDLAWTYKNQSGISIIDHNGSLILMDAQCFTDSDLVSLIKKYSEQGALVGIDAPLWVPNETGSREAENLVKKRAIHSRHISLYSVSRSYLMRSYGVIRGEVLTEMLIEECPSFKLTDSLPGKKWGLFETFPTGICRSLFPELGSLKYKIKPKIPMEETKENMTTLMKRLETLETEEKIISGFLHHAMAVQNMKKKDFKLWEDKVDSLLCALTGFMIHRGLTGEMCFGSTEKGFILLPSEEYAFSKEQTLL